MQHAAFSVWLLPFVVMQRSPTFLAAGMEFMEDNFSMNWGVVGGWFRDNSGVLHLLCNFIFIIILLWCELHFRSSSIRFWRLGPLALMFSRFIHIVACIRASVRFMAEKCCVCWPSLVNDLCVASTFCPLWFMPMRSLALSLSLTLSLSSSPLPSVFFPFVVFSWRFLCSACIDTFLPESFKPTSSGVGPPYGSGCFMGCQDPGWVWVKLFGVHRDAMGVLFDDPEDWASLVVWL